MIEGRCIVVFPSTHMALRGERIAKESGIAARMVPVPRHLSPDCNMGMEAYQEDADRLRMVLSTANVEFDIPAGPPR
jgi:hypothetical protein